MHCYFVFNGTHPSIHPPILPSFLPTPSVKPAYLPPTTDLPTDNRSHDPHTVVAVRHGAELLAAERTNGLPLVGANDFY